MDSLNPVGPDPDLAAPSCQTRALAVLQRLGYTCLPPESLAAERDSSREVILVDRLVAALTRLNPGISTANVHRALRELTGIRARDLLAASQRTYELLIDGAVVAAGRGGRVAPRVRYLDLQQPERNEFLVTWQLPVRGATRQVVLDLVVFVNGIPLVLLLCEPVAATATADPSWRHQALAELWRWQEPDKASHDLGVPRLFETAQLLVALGAETAVYGSVLTPPHRFAGWPTAWPQTPAQVATLLGRPPTAPDLLLCGMLAPTNLLDLLRGFIAFPCDLSTGRTERTLSRSSEFLAVQRAVQHAASGGVSGVIWHALGNGGTHQHRLIAWLVGKLRRDPRQLGRSLLLVGEGSGWDRALSQAVREASAGGCEEVADPETLQLLLTVPESHTLLVSAPLLRTLLKEYPFAPDPECRPLVLIADVLGRHAADLVPLLRQKLPGAYILGFTSTPLATREHTAESPGPYVSTYRFAEAIAEQAAVPVYFAARGAELAASRTSAPERALAVCTDLREHFLRVIRPGGGQAQLLVSSPDVARLYKQTLDRLGGLVSAVHEARYLPGRTAQRRADQAELFISCQPFTTAASPARLQAVYVDTPLRGRTLLQVTLSVNTPAPEKLFGLVIDYAGPGDDLRTALHEFAAADIADALRRPEDELLQLAKGHPEALKLLASAQNLYSLEQCITALESPARRRDFQRALRACARSLELLLDLPLAQGFVGEMRWLGQVLLAAAARYRDARLNLSDYGPRVRELIAEAVLSDDNVRAVERVDLLSKALDDKLAALPTTAAKISELTNALNHELQLRYADDPPFFAGLRERLTHLLAESKDQKGQPELLLTQLFGLRARLASRLGSAVPVGLSATAAVVYEVLTGAEALAAAEAQLRYGAPFDAGGRALAVQIDELIAAHRSAAGNTPSPAGNEALRRAIADRLVAAGYGEERARLLAGRITERLPAPSG